MRITARLVFRLLLLPILLLPKGVSVAQVRIDEWISLGPPGATVQALAVDPSNPNTLYTGSDGSGLFKSTNGGASWPTPDWLRHLSIPLRQTHPTPTSSTREISLASARVRTAARPGEQIRSRWMASKPLRLIHQIPASSTRELMVRGCSRARTAGQAGPRPTQG